ncbi:MAG: SDR family oxidoreductase [Bacteroidetes bacterium]|nr:SDR family oxidoreductase [Bacteroidota bacterium]
MNLSLAGKSALIGGSTQGIGLAIARELSHLGAACVLLGRSQPALEAALNQLDRAAGQSHQTCLADQSDPVQLQQSVQQVLASGPIHILINNSGGPAAGPILPATADAFLQTFQQHLLANHQLAQLLVPGMRQSGYGRIINVISTSVRIPLKNLGVSNTIRGAVAAWAKTLSNELGPDQITVNNILPGFTRTQRLLSLQEEKAKKENKSIHQIEEEWKNEVPLRRIGEPEEVAALASFLASPAAAYINGVSIPVDGGRTGSI